MKRTRINPVSPKTRARNLLWRKITNERILFLRNKYHRTLCEYCGEFGYPFQDGLWGLWGHHMDGNRNNCVKKNCYIAHNACQTVIHDNNIKVSQEDFRGLKMDETAVADKKECPFGISARFCQYQETFSNAWALSSVLEGELLFICNLSDLKECPRMKKLIDGEKDGAI